jgi:hypothetical protein
MKKSGEDQFTAPDKGDGVLDTQGTIADLERQLRVIQTSPAYFDINHADNKTADVEARTLSLKIAELKTQK